MEHLLYRNDSFYFNRRVPKAIRHLDKREIIRFSLKTKDRKKAARLAMRHSEQFEAYWQTLLITGEESDPKVYAAISARASFLGFPYFPAELIAQQPIHKIIQRVEHVAKNDMNEQHAESALGKYAPPSFLLSQVFDRYQEYAKGKIMNKSAHQIRKWANPRIASIKNLIQLIGNKPLTEITREDIQKFRDWWIERIKNDGLSVDSANKQIIFAKAMLEFVNDDLRLGIDIQHLFKKMVLNKEDENRRLPFPSEFIVTNILSSTALADLNDEARWSVFAFAETGAGVNELTGLLPEDIVLDTEIPFIHIRPRQGRSLKTKYRVRTIPLVGYALDAFRACPDGFPRYRDKTDSLSGLLGKYFRTHNLLPTEQHSIYSFRHSFQDRLLAVNTPDRIQADLMGHKFGRPRYGDGATLAHKLEWMRKIQLKPS